MEATNTRMKITIKEILPSPDKWKDKLSKFLGADGITYDCWHKSFPPFLQAGKIIDVDVKTEEKNGYMHHEIVQLFENNQPQFNQKQGLGGGGFRGRTPEETAAQNKSIQEQTAFKGAVELMVADKCPKELSKAATLWALKQLGAVMSDKEASALFEKQPAAPVAQQPAEPIKETAKQETGQGAQSGRGQAAPKRDLAMIKNWGALCTACKEDFKMSRADVLSFLKATDFIQLNEEPADCYIRIAAARG